MYLPYNFLFTMAQAILNSSNMVDGVFESPKQKSTSNIYKSIQANALDKSLRLHLAASNVQEVNQKSIDNQLTHLQNLMGADKVSTHGNAIPVASSTGNKDDKRTRVMKKRPPTPIPSNVTMTARNANQFRPPVLKSSRITVTPTVPDAGKQIMLDLGDDIYLQTSEYEGRPTIHIRQFSAYISRGNKKFYPTKIGFTMSYDSFIALYEERSEIDEAMKQINDGLKCTYRIHLGKNRYVVVSAKGEVTFTNYYLPHNATVLKRGNTEITLKTCQWATLSKIYMDRVFDECSTLKSTIPCYMSHNKEEKYECVNCLPNGDLEISFEN